MIIGVDLLTTARTWVVPRSIAQFGVPVKNTGSRNVLSGSNQFVHVPLLVEVAESFGESIDENTRIRRFRFNLRVATVFVIEGKIGFADAGAWSTVVADGIRRRAIDLDFSEQVTTCEQPSPKENSERRGDGHVDSVLNVGKDSDEDTCEEDDHLDRRCLPELIDNIRRGDEVADRMDNDSRKTCTGDVEEHAGEGVKGK